MPTRITHSPWPKKLRQHYCHMCTQTSISASEEHTTDLNLYNCLKLRWSTGGSYERKTQPLLNFYLSEDFQLLWCCRGQMSSSVFCGDVSSRTWKLNFIDKAADGGQHRGTCLVATGHQQNIPLCRLSSSVGIFVDSRSKRMTGKCPKAKTKQ